MTRPGAHGQWAGRALPLCRGRAGPRQHGGWGDPRLTPGSARPWAPLQHPNPSPTSSSRPPPETPFPSSFLPNRLTASAQLTDARSSNLFVVTSIFRSPAAKLTQMKTTVASLGHTTGRVELLVGAVPVTVAPLVGDQRGQEEGPPLGQVTHKPQPHCPHLGETGEARGPHERGHSLLPWRAL